MQIDNRIAGTRGDGTAWQLGLDVDAGPDVEQLRTIGVVKTRFADWGIGLVVDLKFSQPPGPPLVPPQGPPLVPPQGPPLAPPQGPPLAPPQGPPLNPPT